jgi:hypothetical protein
MYTTSPEAPKARNMIARPKREARQPGVILKNQTEALKGRHRDLNQFVSCLQRSLDLSMDGQPRALPWAFIFRVFGASLCFFRW